MQKLNQILFAAGIIMLLITIYNLHQTAASVGRINQMLSNIGELSCR